MISTSIQAGFKRAFNEIEVLRAKIHQQGGIWIFKTHKYTADELLKSEHHARIYAITEKLGDDVKHWHNTGKLSNRDFNYYHEQRLAIEEEIRNVNIEIVNRTPTRFEQFIGVLHVFTNLVMANMPELQRFLPEPLSKVLWFLPSGNPIKLLTRSGNSE